MADVIAQLRGRLVSAGLGRAVVDVGGVGYLVQVPPGSVAAAPGTEITLHTHLAVRDDALTLYGFPRPSARDLFEVLLGVTGLGPRLALAAIGTLGPDGLRRAVVSEDVAALTVVPGIGRKGAQRMILELREKLGALPAETASGAHGAANGDVREALASLGYSAAEVHSAMEELAAHSGAEPDDLLRQALRSLGSRS